MSKLDDVKSFVIKSFQDRVTKASAAGAISAIAMWALATFAFPGGVIPLEVQTAVPVVAAYVAGVVVPHSPQSVVAPPSPTDPPK